MISDKKISSVSIYFRGKNKDVYGNPYYAWIAIIETSYTSYYKQIVLPCSMSPGDSAKCDITKWVYIGIKEALGIDCSTLCNVKLYYQHATRDVQLENPMRWDLSTDKWEEVEP